MLHVLNEQGVTETQCTLENLKEGFVKETGDGNFAVLVLIEQEVGGLSSRVDDEWVTAESLDHDRVLDAQVI